MDYQINVPDAYKTTRVLTTGDYANAAFYFSEIGTVVVSGLSDSGGQVQVLPEITAIAATSGVTIITFTVNYKKAPSYRLILDYYDSADALTPSATAEQGVIIGSGPETGVGGTVKWLNAVRSADGTLYFADLSAYQTDTTYAGNEYSYVSSQRHFPGGDRITIEGSSFVISGDDFSNEIHVKYVKNVADNTPTYQTTSTGETFNDGVYNFKITSLSPYTAEVTGTVDKNITDVDIPSEVMYHGYSFRITAIGNNAFRDCSSLRAVEIPANVNLIGNGAFYGCSSLSNITIRSEDIDLKIEPDAFCGINSYAVFKGEPLTRYSALSESSNNWNSEYTYVSLTENADSINAGATDENGDDFDLISDPIGLA